MIDTSAAYKTAVQSTEQSWTGKVSIDYSDYNIDNSIAATVQKSNRLSDEPQMADGIESPTYKWWSWNNFEWGQHMRSESSTINEKGALSDRVCDPDKNFGVRVPGASGFTACASTTACTAFENYPSFTVSFLPRTVSQLKVVFDDKLQEYAEEFDVHVYVGNAIDTTYNVTGNTSIKWEQTIATAVLLATAVEVVIKKWSHASSLAKVIESFTSLQETYTGESLYSISVYEESNPVYAESPIGNVVANTCNVRVLNENNRFDNDNTLSPLAGNVIPNRRIIPSLQLNSLDTLSLGQFYATSWNINNTEMFAEVYGQDIISLMEKSQYNKSQFITPGSDQTYTYTTTADFAGFTLDNATATNNELQFGGSAVLCDDSPTPVAVSGFTAASSLTPCSGYLYCGSAEKQISYTYTLGTTVTIEIDDTTTTTVGNFIKYFVSWKSVEEFHEITGGSFSFMPEDITATSQTLKFRIEMYSQSTLSGPSVQDVEVTLVESITLYSLAVKVLEEFDAITGLIEGNYEIDQDFASLSIPNAYLSPNNYKRVLQIITEAGGGRAYQRRDGSIIVEALPEITTAVRNFTDANTYSKREPVSPESLYNRVTVKVNTLTQASSAEEVALANVSILDAEVQNITVFFTVDPTDTITYSGLPAGVTVTDSTIYTWGADLEITNASGSDQDFTLTVNGKPYRVVGGKQYQLDDTESIRKNGVIELVIDNPLIQTIDQAEEIAELLIDSFKNSRREIVAEIVPDPSIELGDTISTDSTRFYNVTRSEIQLRSDRLTQQIAGRR